MNKRREHFAELSDNPSIVKMDIIKSILKSDIMQHEKFMSSIEKVNLALNKLRSGKASHWTVFQLKI